jgi:hypothetical protein
MTEIELKSHKMGAQYTESKALSLRQVNNGNNNFMRKSKASFFFCPPNQFHNRQRPCFNYNCSFSIFSLRMTIKQKLMFFVVIYVGCGLDLFD